MKSDLQIQQDVINQLNWEPFVKVSNVGVSVKNGIVTLAGQVDSFAQKVAAEKAVRKVAGVKAIAEDIQITVESGNKTSDTDIAAAVLYALKWHSAVPEEAIHIKVENGNVTLEGEVDWEYQRHSAKIAVTNLVGVCNVYNNMTVKPKVTAGDVTASINSAFQRAATIDAERITVEVVGNKVILRGKVRTYVEKEDAEDAAWCAPGITTVESHLKVEPELEPYAY